MDVVVRRKARRNAAKVAFGTLAMGCGGTVAPVELPDAGKPRPDATAPFMDSATTPDAALACLAAVDVDASTVTEPEFQCCLGVVEAVIGDAFAADPSVVTSDPSVDNCCKAIIAHVDQTTADYSLGSPTFPTCCAANQTPVGPACTPWGPPMPPPLDARAVTDIEGSMLDLRAVSRRLAPRVDAPAHLREAAVATWHARMINEYASSRVFAALAKHLVACGLDEEADEAEDFADEERRHGTLCGAVVEALGGEARGALFEAPAYPTHPDASSRAALLRNVISICCMSETVAVALIGAERLEMPEGSELRDVLTRIWADEIGHARFGWRMLERLAPKLTEGERRAVCAYLPTAFAHLEAHELAHIPARQGPSGGESLGLCSGLDARVLLRETIDEVIAPRIQMLLS